MLKRSSQMAGMFEFTTQLIEGVAAMKKDEMYPLSLIVHDSKCFTVLLPQFDQDINN